MSDSTELVPIAATDSWVPVLGNVATLAQRISDTDFVPKGLRGNVAATTAAILYGREVGLPPMTALTHTSVIDGRPTLSSEAIRGLILAAGHDIVFEESTGSRCTVKGRRKGSENWTTVTWDLTMAEYAGLKGKQNWRKWPRQMLQARATAELARLIFPDVTHGLMAAEEAGDTKEVAASAPAEATTKVSRKRAIPTKSGGKTRESDVIQEPVQRPEIEGPPLPTDEPPTDPGQEPLTASQRAGMYAQFHRLGIKDKDQQLACLSGIVQRELDSRTAITTAEASHVLNTLARVQSTEELQALITTGAAPQNADETTGGGETDNAAEEPVGEPEAR